VFLRSTGFYILSLVGKDRFTAVKASFIANGLTTRQHGNSKHLPHNALTFEDNTNVVTFLHNYAEANAILLLGRIPGYKRDDIVLLPSCTSKRVTTPNYVCTVYVCVHICKHVHVSPQCNDIHTVYALSTHTQHTCSTHIYTTHTHCMCVHTVHGCLHSSHVCA